MCLSTLDVASVNDSCECLFPCRVPLLMFPHPCVSIGDKSALRPSGLRFGSPALTSRGLVETDFKKVADYIHRGNLFFF